MKKKNKKKKKKTHDKETSVHQNVILHVIHIVYIKY
jgi:hypothetical protein